MTSDSFFAALRDRWLFIVLVTLGGAGVGALGYLLVDQYYEATATVALWSPTQGGDATSVMATEARVVGSRDVAMRAIDELGLDVTPAELVRDISVEVPAGSVLDITVRGADAEDAARRADAAAQAYLDLRTERTTANVERQLSLLDERADVLEGEELRALEQRRLDIVLGGGDSASMINPAFIPTSHAGPPFVAYPLAGGMLGLVLGVAVALVLRRRELDAPTAGHREA